MAQEQKLKVKTLKDFRSSLKICRLFQDANDKLPQFLEQNLVDEARSIKIFKNDQLAYIKVFYFQFLKLCFETEDVDYDTKTNKFIELLENNVNLLRLSSKFKHQLVSASNLKDILFEFLQMLSQCKQLVQSSLARYPAIGDIITNLFCDLTLNEGQVTEEELNSMKTMQYLAGLFDVDIVQYDNCIQFTDAQVYSYKHSEQKIYMVYIDQKKIIRTQKKEEESEDLSIQNSCKSIGGEFQVIAFDGTDVVFHETSSSNQFADTKQKLNELQTAETFCKTPIFETLKNPLMLLSYQKENKFTPKYLNITKQFTNTFILDSVVSQPYRSKIKNIKTRARDERKSRQMFWL